MRWSSTVSEVGVLEAALDEAVGELDADPDLVIVFAPARLARGGLLRQLRARFARATIVGASASGVIGGGREVERRPALALTTARLPGTELTWVDPAAPEVPDDAAGVLLLAEPHSDVDKAVRALDAATSAPIFGGVASGGSDAGTYSLLADDQRHASGAIALAFRGAIEIETLVAQGCRPIGEPMIVVRSEGNLIVEVDKGSPLDVLRALHATLTPREQELFRHSLFLGVELEDKRGGVYRQGDFLVRNLLGADPDRGAIAVAEPLSGHPVVQFHLRDAETSATDLDRHLEGCAGPAEGGLVFSCVGRGEGLYGVADHDSDRIVARAFPDRPKPQAPLGGFFCNGEIGPVGQRTFLHGYTTSLALFRPR